VTVAPAEQQKPRRLSIKYCMYNGIMYDDRGGDDSGMCFNQEIVNEHGTACRILLCALVFCCVFIIIIILILQ